MYIDFALIRRYNYQTSLIHHPLRKMHITKIFSFLVSVTLLILLFSVLVPAQTNDDCLMCHDDDEFTMEKNGREISINVVERHYNNSSHSTLNCTSCHIKFDAEEIPHSNNLQPKLCSDCHTKALVKHLFHPRILKTSGTEKGKDVNCIGCHDYHYVSDPNDADGKWSAENLSVSCGNCHEEESAKYLTSGHYVAFMDGVQGAPNCLHCHKNPVAKFNSPADSVEVKLAQENLCLSCHLDDPDVRSRISPTSHFISLYDESVHGKALHSGNPKAANCVDCHNSHDVLRSTFLESPTFKSNIPITCSQCHEQIFDEYKGSVHAKALERGDCDCPVCTDCHGEHNILKHDDPKSPVAFQNLSREVCSPCHSSLKLSEKYGIASDKYKSFEDSYHGLALDGGSVEVANCASCHGDHNIKPSSDPTSRIHKDNLVETCGSCHPGANENFTVGKIHVTRQDENEPILHLIATLYIFLIISTIGGMFAHNAIDLFRKARIKKLKLRGFMREEHYGHSLYLRMSLNERIQHVTLAVSFMLLVTTGFMLSFPNSWWVTQIRNLSSDTFEYRGLVHRISAVVMVVVSLYHIFYIIFIPRGRKLIKDLLPKFQDIKDAIGVVRFNVGITDKKPKLDRFSYVEKAEYWALIWGTIVMSLTGIIMWFDNTFIGLFTKLGWDVARTIHYYEAWLAFLSILVWHFYFVMFNPDIYPMNVAWFKGTVSEEEMAEEHPLEYERLKKEENIKSENDPDKE